MYHRLKSHLISAHVYSACQSAAILNDVLRSDTVRVKTAPLIRSIGVHRNTVKNYALIASDAGLINRTAGPNIQTGWLYGYTPVASDVVEYYRLITSVWRDLRVRNGMQRPDLAAFSYVLSNAFASSVWFSHEGHVLNGEIPHLTVINGRVKLSVTDNTGQTPDLTRSV